MKKLSILIIFVVLNIFLIIRSSQIVAVEPSPEGSNTPTPTPSTSFSAPNPAPPLGTPCGKTMCLDNEICVKYPHDADEHCVSKDIDPAAIKADPVMIPDCWDEYGQYKGEFPPNAQCWNHFKQVPKNISAYDKTCIYQPVVLYTDERTLHGGEQPFALCGNGDPGPHATVQSPGGGDNRCWVAMLVYTDVRQATLGSYGPDQQAIDENSTDFLAQNYLYNSLFARPDDLSETNREAYRTYWRLLPDNNQANLRSFVMNMAHDKYIDDIHFKFKDTNGNEKETSFTELYNKLKLQVILFMHAPFIRVGCLTDYPVCPEYAQAIKDFSTPTNDLLEIADKFPLPAALDVAMASYKAYLTSRSLDLGGSYAAFTPLDFNSVRDYIVKKKDEVEEEFYAKPGYENKLVDNLNAPRYGTNKPNLTNITRENLPYVGAIHQGLLSPKFGLLSTIQASWVTQKYATSEGSPLYDYSSGNKPEDLPEVKIARKNLLTRLQDELAAFVKNPLTWVIDWVTPDLSFKTEDTFKLGYNDNRVDNPDDVVRSAYVNMKGCPLPVSYHLLSPQTANKASGQPLEGVSKDDHHQIVYISGKHIQWAYTPKSWLIEEEEKNCTVKPDGTLRCIRTKPCPNDDAHYREGNTCFERHWDLTAIKDGKALTVLNSPQQKDIKTAVIQDDSFSLYKTLLPDLEGKKKVVDASVDAPVARHFTSYLDGGSASSTAPTGDTTIFNPAEPINRLNNRAQDSVHLLQNCWTVPEGLQNSPRCKLALVESDSDSACTGEAFKKLIPNPEKSTAKGQATSAEAISKLTDEQIKAYAEAEKQTGVPCEVLAGIHYREADSNPEQDLQSGGQLGGRSLTESAVQAATELLGKAGGEITDLDTLIKALSWYNGGGNANCQASGSTNCPAASGKNVCGVTLGCSDANTAACVCTSQHPEAGSCRSQCVNGFPFQFSYAGTCPPQSVGYDDPYVVELWKPEYDNMYILYKYDCTPSRPEQQNRLGTLTFAIDYYLSHQK